MMERVLTEFPSIVKGMFGLGDTRNEQLLKLVTAASAWVISYYVPHESSAKAATGLGLVIVADTIAGWTAACIQGVERDSRKLSRVISKSFAYLSVVTLAAVVQNTISKDTPIVTVILWIGIANEGYSILEKVEKMGLGRFAVLRKILGKVISENDSGSTESEEKEKAE